MIMALTKAERELFDEKFSGVDEKFRGFHAMMDAEFEVMNTKFESLTHNIDNKFESLAHKMDNMLCQVKTTNGRMTEAEYQIRKLQDDSLTKVHIYASKADIKELKEDKMFWTRAGKVLASALLVASITITILSSLGVIF